MAIILRGASGAAVEALTYGEAADLLDVARPTVSTYTHRGVLHPIRPARTAYYPIGTPFILADEIAWYATRRRSPNNADVGPSPYAERYADLLAAGALAEVADPVAALAASLTAADRAAAVDRAAQLRTATAQTPTPTGTPASVEASLAWGAILALLAIVLLALFTGRKPDAGKVRKLRRMPGAGRLPDALRSAAELLDTAA